MLGFLTERIFASAVTLTVTNLVVSGHRRRAKHEEFEVETDVAGEWPIPVCTETVRRVVVE